MDLNNSNLEINLDDLCDENDSTFAPLGDCTYLSVGEILTLLPANYVNGVNIMHINCRSIAKNWNAIKLLANHLTYPVTAIAVTETWIKDYMLDYYNLPGYQLVGNSRADRGGGGVGLYINEKFDFTIRTDLSIMIADLECIFVEILQSGKKNIIIGSVYRPPNTDVVNFGVNFSNLLDILDKESNKLLFIAGDFNLDLIKHDTHAATNDFLNSLLSHSFLPTITKPTRVTDLSSTLIDNIFTNSSRSVFKSGIILHDLSDHFPIMLHVNLAVNFKPPNNNSLFTRDYSRDCIVKFNNSLNLQNWSLVFGDPPWDPNICYTRFHKVYSDLYNFSFMHKKTKSFKMTPRHPWITPGLMRSCIKKGKLFKIYLNDKTDENKRMYITYRNKLKSLTIKAERAYYKLRFQEKVGDIKETWKLVNSIISKRPLSTETTHIIVEDIKITDKVDIANHYNNYFTDLGTTLASTIPPAHKSFQDYLTGNILNSFSLYLTDSIEVINVVSDLKNNSSEGYDGISVKVLKQTISPVAHVIAQLINLSFTSGIFPDALKIAKICPIFKSGNRYDIGNYRPISILPCISKIYEKMIFSRLTKYLDKNNLLSDNQYGFRKGHSSYMALLDMHNSVTSSIERSEYAIGVFLDLSKAFDTVNHDILLKKLAHYGVRGIPLQLFASYLRQRQQYVSFGESSRV